MRADRLVSLVLLLRRHGRLSAATLARELEVSTRTVLRDIDALSAAGVPVYAERGRHGGYALLPGFRTDLTGLNHDEALALLVAGSRRGAQAFGLGSALASAMLKVIDALPENQRDLAVKVTERLLIDPETDLLARRQTVEEVPDAVMAEVRRAVFAGHRLRIRYAPPNQDPRWRTVDPIGLVTVRDQGYLLAARSGADRTYRLTRILAAEALTEPAHRPGQVDLDRAWQERGTRFRTSGAQVTALIHLNPTRRETLTNTALAILSEQTTPTGQLRLEATFQDHRHAEWALWQLGPDAEALTPHSLRTALHHRATTTATRYT
ncbi:WYL domain-containing protein [Actinocorallia sp. API 0066]|uniref:helix-turn-helix transcriptional regulator n=1 Tax=Actinocorallia sp. API 0066 TaxID=2896846 RepID=UPI001E4CC9B6|nr:WYL domain-containing protein [Actinocorallia sp. API 0066]MCD0453338.1 WYL domain-containing protein [Actinocorallia sp. API 0066]